MDAMTMKMDAQYKEIKSCKSAITVETPINFNSDDDDEEPAPQPQTPKPIKETPTPKPFKPRITYSQRLQKEKMEARYGKLLDMIRAV
nr:reverse transcriptase domain-containing protein [Tanacetum cinerariifolium]